MHWFYPKYKKIGSSKQGINILNCNGVHKTPFVSAIVMHLRERETMSEMINLVSYQASLKYLHANATNTLYPVDLPVFNLPIRLD